MAAMSSRLMTWRFKLDATVRDARHVEQVVHQVCEVIGLALEHFTGALDHARVRRRAAQNVRHVANGSQRITQLVRQHGEELILAPVVFTQGLRRRMGLARMFIGTAHRPLQRVHDESREHCQQEKKVTCATHSMGGASCGQLVNQMVARTGVMAPARIAGPRPAR